jgi:two-component system OmpR family sensor kinase
VIRRSSLRWRLVAWVIGVMLLALAMVFVVVYLQTGSQLRSQVDDDLGEDLSQFVQAAHSQHPAGPDQLASQLRHYVQVQPYSASSSLLFAVIDGHALVSNHPELFGAARPEDGETVAEQQRENRDGRALLADRPGLRTAAIPDGASVRLAERVVTVARVRVRLGVGESLEIVTRAQRSVARAFLIAGAVGLALVLIASYLAGAAVSAPLRRMARVATRVDDGDLLPRMSPPPSAASEIRVLAESFNHMLDRLEVAFQHQRDFVADASHELRTPLTVISGQLEVLAADDRPTPKDIRRVQRLVAAEVARISRMVDDMLLLARAEQRDFLRPSTIELPRFIDDLWATTTAGRQRRLALTSVPAGTLRADPDRLAQALRNLIDNALAHTTAPHGLVALQTTVLPGGRCRFTVTDDGPGIPAGERRRVFERFHRTDAARARVAGGTGLGLAIVHVIAVAHGGSVAARPPAGGVGARLELTLPGYSPTTARPREADTPDLGDQSPSGPRSRVLRTRGAERPWVQAAA